MATADTSTWLREAGPSDLFRLRDFRLLLAIQVAAGLRGPLLWFAQAWYVNDAAEDGRRVLLLGVLATVNGTAFLGWSLFGGALADRYPRRTMLMASHLAGAVCVAVTAVVLLLPGVGGGGWFFIILPLFATFGLMNAQDLPARTSLVADIVPDRLVIVAVTVNWLVLAVVMLLANYLGGFFVQRLGFGVTYALGVAPHLVIVVLLSRLQLANTAADEGASGRSLLRNIHDGIAYLRGESAVRWTVLVMWVSVTGGVNVLWTLGAWWMDEVLGVDPTGWSVLTIFWSIGMVLASASLFAMGDYRRKGRRYVTAALTYAVAVLVYALSRSVWLTGAALLVAGFAFQNQQTIATAILQTVVPRNLLGRVTALLFLSQGLAQSSGLAFGALGQFIGLQATFPAIGLTLLAIAIAVAVVQRPLRTLA
ncbi:MAG: MFS transporter [Chloroflexi bacterium]|nr:MFS transporter [Chloroflexota bacterium]